MSWGRSAVIVSVFGEFGCGGSVMDEQVSKWSEAIESVCIRWRM